MVGVKPGRHIGQTTSVRPETFRCPRLIFRSAPAGFPPGLVSSINISNTSKEVELVRNPEPGAGRRDRRNGQPEEPAPDDDRLLDHHIEEVLGAFRDLRDAPDTQER